MLEELIKNKTSSNWKYAGMKRIRSLGKPISLNPLPNLFTS